MSCAPDAIVRGLPGQTLRFSLLRLYPNRTPCHLKSQSAFAIHRRLISQSLSRAGWPPSPACDYTDVRFLSVEYYEKGVPHFSRFLRRGRRGRRQRRVFVSHTPTVG